MSAHANAKLEPLNVGRVFLTVTLEMSDAACINESADELARFGAAALLVAHARGDDDSDPAKTFQDALGAGLICSQLSIRLRELQGSGR